MSSTPSPEPVSAPSSRRYERWIRVLDRLGHWLGDRRGRIPLDNFAKYLTVLTILSVLLSWVLNWDRLQETRDVMFQSAMGAVFMVFGQIFLLLNVAYLIWQVWLFRQYKSWPPLPDRRLPTCSVIVPAYNEGRQVLGTLRSLCASDYPAERLQIIAVDDGSRDDTWAWMCQAKRELGDRIMVLKQPCNKGKREALHRGFLQSTGEVLVTVDSDSIVEPKTLRMMCCGFIHDLRVGAVAGNVRVLNLHEGIIPRMLDVSFVFSFHFIRASQSLVNTVMCTPGALSAYRRDVLFKKVAGFENVLSEWLTQTFWGQPRNIGEDRAMTNLILREGYYVHFQEDAVVYTNVPTTYRTLCNMLIRWARSNVRENLSMSTFTFRKFRAGPMSGARINLVQQLFAMVVPPLFLGAIMLCLFWRPHIFLLYILVGTAVWSSVPAIIYAMRHRSSEALWAYAYGGFYFAALSWINAYSLFTVRRSGWLTRQTPAMPAAPPPAVK